MLKPVMFVFSLFKSIFLNKTYQKYDDCDIIHCAQTLLVSVSTLDRGIWPESNAAHFKAISTKELMLKDKRA